MRRRSRSCALQMLYQLELSKDLSTEAVREPALRSAITRFWHNFESLEANDAQFSERLVLGVARNLAALDDALARCSRNWRLSRMDKVDLCILRLAAYELLFCPDLPRAATLNEAIELAKLFSGRDSSSFVNGVLDQLAVDKAEPDAEGHAESGDDGDDGRAERDHGGGSQAAGERAASPQAPC